MIKIIIASLIVTVTLFLLYAMIMFSFTISPILGSFMIVFAVLFLFFSLISLGREAAKEEQKKHPTRSKFAERLEEAKRIQEQKRD